ncbi:TPA: hypothetical protein ACYLN4_000680 [Burkholderia lata]
MTLADEERDTLRLALGYIGSSDRPDRMTHVARIRALLDAEPGGPAAALPEQIGVQEAWEAAGGNPGIKATREQLVAALKMLDGSNEDADLLGDLVREALRHLYAGQVGFARACLARATEVTFTGAAKSSAEARPDDERSVSVEALITRFNEFPIPTKVGVTRIMRIIDEVAQASRPDAAALAVPQRLTDEAATQGLKSTCPALTSSERLAIERAITALKADPVAVSVLETLLRAASGAATRPHAPVLSAEMRLSIENAILALDQGVAPGSEHANDLRFVLKELDGRAVEVQSAAGEPVAYIISGPGGDGLAWAKDLHHVRADLTRAPLCRCRCKASAEHSNERKHRHYNPIYNTDPVQRACGELPEGWEIRISLENGAGTIDVYDPNGNNIDFESDADHFDWRIHEAVDTALECGSGEACK